MSERRWWFIDWLRPVCPHCDGKGGFMSGYYEPDFYGCECCNPDEDDDSPVTHVWRWQWWLFVFREWKHQRALDRWIDEQLAMDEAVSAAPPPDPDQREAREA